MLDDLTVAIVKVTAGGKQLGTGPFVTTSTSDNELVMSAVPNYYRGEPSIDRIVWKSYPAVRTAWAAMMRGEIDFLYEVAPDAVQFIKPETSVQVFSFLRSYVNAVVFNARHSPFEKAQVRRALNYSINREALIQQALGGAGRPSSGPVWLQHWAYDSSAPGYSYDPSRAAALLDAAGVPPSKVSKIGAAPSRLRFSCLVPQGFASWERMALIVQRDLSEIGVDMQLDSVSFGDFNHRIASGDFDSVILELVVGNSPSRPFTFWYSQSKQNSWGFKSPSVDRALDGIRHASNDSDYRQSFRDFQLQTMDEAPAIFLALGETTRAVSKRFRVSAPPGSDIFSTIADWRPVAGEVPGTTN